MRDSEIMRSVLGYAGVLVPLFGPFLNHTPLAATTDNSVLSAPAPVHSNPAPTGTPKEVSQLPLDMATGLLCLLRISVLGKKAQSLEKKKKKERWTSWSCCDCLSIGQVVIKPTVKHLKVTEVLVKLCVKPTNGWPLSHSWKGLHTEAAELITAMQMNLKKNCHRLVNTKTPGCQGWLDKMAFHPPWHIDCTHSTWDTDPSADRRNVMGVWGFAVVMWRMQVTIFAVYQTNVINDRTYSMTASEITGLDFWEDRKLRDSVSLLNRTLVRNMICKYKQNLSLNQSGKEKRENASYIIVYSLQTNFKICREKNASTIPCRSNTERKSPMFVDKTHTWNIWG